MNFRSKNLSSYFIVQNKDGNFYATYFSPDKETEDSIKFGPIIYNAVLYAIGDSDNIDIQPKPWSEVKTKKAKYEYFSRIIHYLNLNKDIPAIEYFFVGDTFKVDSNVSYINKNYKINKTIKHQKSNIAKYSRFSRSNNQILIGPLEKGMADIDIGVGNEVGKYWFRSYFKKMEKSNNNSKELKISPKQPDMWVPKIHLKTINNLNKKILEIIKKNKNLQEINEYILHAMYSKEIISQIRCNIIQKHQLFNSMFPVLTDQVKKLEIENSNKKIIYCNSISFTHYLYDEIQIDKNSKNNEYSGTEILNKKDNMPSRCYYIINGNSIPLFLSAFCPKDNILSFFNQPLADLSILNLKEDDKTLTNKKMFNNLTSKTYFNSSEKKVYMGSSKTSGLSIGYDMSASTRMNIASKPIKSILGNWYVSGLFFPYLKDSEKTPEELKQKKELKEKLDSYLCRWTRPEDIDQIKGYLRLNIQLEYDNGYLVPTQIRKLSSNDPNTKNLLGYSSVSKELSLAANLNCLSEFTSPERLLLGVKHILNAQALVNAEPPYVSSSWLEEHLFDKFVPKENTIQNMDSIGYLFTQDFGNKSLNYGVNLVTAFSLNFIGCHEDGLVISKSASKKLRSIGKNIIIKKDFENNNKSNLWQRYYERSKGKELLKIEVELEEDLQIGDKLSNRHGWKGVVTEILEDNKMPKVFVSTDNKEYKYADIIVNPYSILKRGAWGIIAEALLGKLSYNQKLRFSAHPYYSQGGKTKLNPPKRRLIKELNKANDSNGFVYWLKMPQTAKGELVIHNKNDYDIAIKLLKHKKNITKYQIFSSSKLNKIFTEDYKGALLKSENLKKTFEFSSNGLKIHLTKHLVYLPLLTKNNTEYFLKNILKLDSRIEYFLDIKSIVDKIQLTILDVNKSNKKKVLSDYKKTEFIISKLDKVELNQLIDILYRYYGKYKSRIILNENGLEEITTPFELPKENIFKNKNTIWDILDIVYKHLKNILIEIKIPNSGRAILTTDINLDINEIILPASYIRLNKDRENKSTGFALINRYPTINQHGLKIVKISSKSSISESIIIHPFLLKSLEGDIDGDALDFVRIEKWEDFNEKLDIPILEEMLPSKYQKCFDNDLNSLNENNKEFAIFTEASEKDAKNSLTNIISTYIKSLAKDEYKLKQTYNLFYGQDNFDDYKKIDNICKDLIIKHSKKKTKIKRSGGVIKNLQDKFLLNLVYNDNKDADKSAEYLTKLAPYSHELQTAALDKTGNKQANPLEDVEVYLSKELVDFKNQIALDKNNEIEDLNEVKKSLLNTIGKLNSSNNKGISFLIDVFYLETKGVEFEFKNLINNLKNIGNNINANKIERELIDYNAISKKILNNTKNWDESYYSLTWRVFKEELQKVILNLRIKETKEQFGVKSQKYEWIHKWLNEEPSEKDLDRIANLNEYRHNKRDLNTVFINFFRDNYAELDEEFALEIAKFHIEKDFNGSIPEECRIV